MCNESEILGPFHESSVVNSYKNVTYLKVSCSVSQQSVALWVSWSSEQGPLGDSYLVDPASSHMLVSKIKPCMSKFKQ